MANWWDLPYQGGPMVKVSGFPRPCYPADAAKQGKQPSVNGPDVEAYKRTVSRAGRWPWGTFDQEFSNSFSHGQAGGNVASSGVAGVQRQQKLDDTGWIGEKTFNTLRSIRCPTGPHKGEMAMDARAVELINQAWDMFGGSEPAPDPAPAVELVREALTAFAEIGWANAPRWDYQMVRPLDVTVDPHGPVVSDCSMSAIQMFKWAGRQTGIDVPDPSQQGYSGYGNTTYYEVNHPRVSGQYLIGDLGHYGDGYTSSHVTVCVKAGDSDVADWWSFGSEPPSKRKLYYRTDFMYVVRPPLS